MIQNPVGVLTFDRSGNRMFQIVDNVFRIGLRVSWNLFRTTGLEDAKVGI